MIIFCYELLRLMKHFGIHYFECFEINTSFEAWTTFKYSNSSRSILWGRTLTIWATKTCYSKIFIHLRQHYGNSVENRCFITRNGVPILHKELPLLYRHSVPSSGNKISIPGHFGPFRKGQGQVAVLCRRVIL